MYAIIGGTGLDRLADLEVVRREVMRTPYGEPSSAFTFGKLKGNDVVFLARHGHGHTIPPHRINYRANLWALSEAKVEGVVAIASVGSIRATLNPGDLLAPDQIIDYTHGRGHTYFDGTGAPVTHIDFTWPYSPSMRERLLAAAKTAGETLQDGAVYGATQGPRLETAAEIRRMERDGCDLVGMTGMPEAALARELGLPYACLAVVVNHAAGLGDSKQMISVEHLDEMARKAMASVYRILEALVALPGPAAAAKA
ncbi:MAG TPA: S-methyl-5'-thioinosine phosphorylase [Burkholderiales bacterium]|jgi:5'-methylthioadenosine phosphorylase|nr:S-methyl-5'-thioinosine phosphorylase [Burkholderiales bacterium]